MIIGFTGTHLGMSGPQRETLARLLEELQCHEFHHGDCIGADAQAHLAARAHGARIVIHPPLNPRSRAYCEGADVVLEPLPYLERNREIVLACEQLLAAPHSIREQRRSGTWATVRFARSVERPLLILAR